MPTRPLPNDPSLEHLRKQAKRLLHAVEAGDADALAQVREFHPYAQESIGRFALADAQLVVARSYEFASWARLKQHLAEIEPLIWNPPAANPNDKIDVFLRFACLTYLDWRPAYAGRALQMLAEEPGLAHASIHVAAAVGDVAALRSQIEYTPASVNASGGPLNWAPLLYACYSRLDATGDRSTLECARLLLAHGADPDAGFLFSGSYAFTALTGAFGRGEDWPNQTPHPQCDDLARVLLEAGADPNDSQALYNRHFKPDDAHLELLFEYGLGQDKGGPWLKRLGHENGSPGRILVQQLCWAASRHFPARVRLLVEHGTDVNGRSLRTGRTAYEEALRSGHRDIAEYLAANGANKIELDPLETFALTCIAGREDEARRRLTEDPGLLDRLGDKGRVDMLHRALEARSHEGLRLITKLGVDINGMLGGGGHDRAVLHNASAWGSLETVKLLIELGADPRLRDLTYHGAAIGWALYGKRPEIIEYLLAFADIRDSVRAGGVQRVAALLEADPELRTTTDDEGRGLVYYLNPESSRVEEMAALLAAHGVDFNARDKDGMTLLARVEAARMREFARLLREFGAVS
jgi:ankyrin repeat protein